MPDHINIVEEPKQYLVTVTETVKVYAANEAEAKLVGWEQIAFIGGETEDTQAELI